MTKPDAVVIGISVADRNSESAKAIAALVSNLGAVAMLFDAHTSRNSKDDMVLLDAIILMGNDYDIEPERYIHRYAVGDVRRCIHPKTVLETDCEVGCARAHYEYEVIDHAIALAIPLVGICGGMQRINVHLGGTLHQHVPDLVGDDRHCQRTRGVNFATAEIPIIIKGDTLLAEIAEEIVMPFCSVNHARDPKVLMENSVHHQAVDEVAPHLLACSFAERLYLHNAQSQYLVKAIERHPEGKYAKQFILGIQWHPEFRASGFGECMIKRVIQEAKDYRKKK